MIRRKHYNVIGIDQDLDASCNGHGDSSHNTSRKCKAIKRKTSKRMRRVLKDDTNDQRDDSI